ncbi:hypothetical protein MBANPS3_006626 [Mucor bainieri]
MATKGSLPFEIFSRVFDYIDSAKVLAQCRSVCKRWDRPAEYAMLGKQLTITFTNSLAFYHHLHKKPANAQRIKHLHFNVLVCTDLIIKILRLAITPSIETIRFTIHHLDDTFYNELIAIGSATKLTHLRAIPCPYNYQEIHEKAMLQFKDTLEELSDGYGDAYYIHRLFFKLDEFKCLKKLSIHGYLEDIAELDSIVKNAHQLQELEVYGEMNAGDLWTEADVQNWLRDNVQVVPSLTKVRFFYGISQSDEDYTKITSPWLLEYLTFKYPNIDYVDTSANVMHQVGDDYLEIPARMCSAVSKVRSYNIDLVFLDTWNPAYDSLIGDINIVKVAYTKEAYVMSCRRVKSQVNQRGGGEDEATAGKRTTEFQLEIGQRCMKTILNKDDVSHFILLWEMATTFMTAIIKIDLTDDCGYCDSPDNPQTTFESTFFFKILQVISSKQPMQIAVRKLQAVPEEAIAIKTDKSQLDALEICFAEIDSKVLSTLAQMVSSINVLTFTCCLIGRDEEVARKLNAFMSCIYLPSTKLRQLVISYKVHTDIGDVGYTAQMKQKTSGMDRTTYISLDMDHGSSLTFRLCYASGKAIPIPLHEYNVVAATITRPEPAIHIICQSLEQIIVCFDHVSFDIDVGKHTKSSVFSALQNGGSSSTRSNSFLAMPLEKQEAMVWSFNKHMHEKPSVL